MSIFNRLIKVKLPIVFMIIFTLMFATGCSSDVVPKESAPEVISQKSIDQEQKDIEVTENVESTPISDDEGEPLIEEGLLEVHFIDVGQGDSILIKQGNSNMLIDAGENNKGKQVVSYLRAQKVESLDYVIGTHPHSDHIGGLDDVINSFDVSNVIMPEKTHTTKTFEDVITAISNKGLKITKPVVGESYNVGNSKFTIVAPNKSDYGNLNDYSVSIKLEHGNNSFMFTGDAESTSEQEMVDNDINLKADVLKAGHHGSNTSSINSFINEVKPKYVVIQVAENNKYKHPNIEIIERFKSIGAQIYRNDQHGHVVAKSDGSQISFTTQSNNAVENVQESPADPADTVEPIEKTSQLGDDYNNAVIGTKSTKVFHKEDCRHVAKEGNRESFDSKQAAIDAGFRGCKVCSP